LLIGLPLLLAVCFISLYADMVTRTVQFGSLQLAPAAITALFILTLTNRGLQRLLKRDIFSHVDLLHIYAMLLVGVMVSTRGIVEKLIPPLVYLPYYATRENKLGASLMAHIPPWAVPYDTQAPLQQVPPAIRAYYESGVLSLGLWIRPLLAWFALILCVIWVFACMATLLRRQWVDNEQLRFPLTTLPLAMINDDIDGQPFWSNRLMWVGLAISFLVFGLNGLNVNNPSWPSFILNLNLAPIFTERPYNQMDSIVLYVSLAAIGFAFFLPSDLLFSFWFFFLTTRAQDVITVQMGGLPTSIVSHNTRVWNGYQAAGAYCVLTFSLLRTSWPYLCQVWRTSLARDKASKPLDDSEEMMSYRTALCGLVGGVAFIVLWLTIAGMSPWVALAQMGIYIFFVALITSRGVCGAGVLIADTSFLPMHLISLATPLSTLGGGNLTMMGMTNAIFTRDLRGVLLSPILDNLKMAGDLRARQRGLLLCLGLAVVVALCAASYFFLYLNYAHGGLSLMTYPNFNAGNMYALSARALNGSALVPDSTCYGGFAVGTVVTILLVWLRSAFTWFPLHPLAYALTPTFAFGVLWFSFFIAWVIKSLVMRYGGIELFRRLSPLMLGMILGEFLSAVFWSILTIPFFGWAAPQFPWV
jgi:hypothetical protein